MAEWKALGNIDFVTRMVHHFVHDATACVSQFQKALEMGDPKAFAEAAHGLKGIAGNLGVEKLQAIAIQAEQMGRQSNLEKGATLLASLEAELDQTRKNLQEEL